MICAQKKNLDLEMKVSLVVITRNRLRLNFHRNYKLTKLEIHKSPWHQNSYFIDTAHHYSKKIHTF